MSTEYHHKLKRLLLNAADGSNWETTGTYLFTNNPIDLGGIFNVQLDSTLKVRGFFPGNPYIDTFANFDAIADFAKLELIFLAISSELTLEEKFFWFPSGNVINGI